MASKGKRHGLRRAKRTAILLLSAAAIVVGLFFLRAQFYIISAVIIICAMLPFFISFERRSPRAREVVVLAVMIALAVAGRAAFFALPNIKPMGAVIIVAGACLGAENGFLTGALSAFVSNFIFGQGVWTPFQMFGFGLMGLLAGIAFKEGRLAKNNLTMAAAGIVLTLAVYGPIVDTSSLLFMANSISWKSALGIYLAGIPFNALNAFSTGIILLIIARPLSAKLDRVCNKYGIFNTLL